MGNFYLSYLGSKEPLPGFLLVFAWLQYLIVTINEYPGSDERLAIPTAFGYSQRAQLN